MRWATRLPQGWCLRRASAATQVRHGDPLREILRFEAVDRINPGEMSRVSPPVRGTTSLVTI